MYFQRRNSFLGLLLMVGTVVFPNFCIAATLHAVLVADTNDASIGTSVGIDHKRLQSLVKSISDNTGLSLKVQAITGDQLSLASVNQAINGVSASSEDVVLFYWSGHGYSAGESQFPTMGLKTGTLGLLAVKETLGRKNPRLLIVVGDTCNKPSGSRGEEVPSARDEKPENYRELFLKYRGTIIASGSKRGQYSYGSPQSGGFFTNALLSSLSKELASSSKPSWETLMKRAETPINVGQGIIQEPQSVVNVTYGEISGGGGGSGNNCRFINERGQQVDCGAYEPPGSTSTQKDDDGDCVAGSYYKKDDGKTECCKTDSGGEQCWSLKF